MYSWIKKHGKKYGTVPICYFYAAASVHCVRNNIMRIFHTTLTKGGSFQTRPSTGTFLEVYVSLERRIETTVHCVQCTVHPLIASHCQAGRATLHDDRVLGSCCLTVCHSSSAWSSRYIKIYMLCSPSASSIYCMLKSLDVGRGKVG